jgi:hypothetical protein
MSADRFQSLFSVLQSAAMVAFPIDLLAAASPAPGSTARNWGCTLPCFIAVFVLGLIGAAITKYVESIRSKKIEEVARGLGLTFRRKPSEADKTLPVGSRLVEDAFAPRVSNVLEAARTADLNLTVFDYAYEPRGSMRSDSNTKVKQTVTRMESGFLNLPKFVLFPGGFFEKMEVRFGQTDINFPDSPEFSRRYILRGDDEPAIRALFNPILRRALEGQFGVTIEGGSQLLFIFRAGVRQKPEELSGKIEQDKAIAALFYEAQRSIGVRPPPLPPN